MTSLPAAFMFDSFELRVDRRVLLRDGERVPLGTRGFDLLFALVRRRGALATKDELMAEVWPGISVEENNLTTQMATLRRLLGEKRGESRYLRTLSRRGYCFAATLVESSAPLASHAGMSLPAPLTGLVGREREIEEVGARLADRRLVSLVGPGGVGKTRVALAVAGRESAGYADGVRLVELAPLIDPARVADAVCLSLGVAHSERRGALEVAIELLRPRRMLLVLDNCEHVAAGAVAFAAAAARHCPGVRLLATAREPLGIAGEWVYRLGPLPLWRGAGAPSAADALATDAVALFVARAADARGAFELTDADSGTVVTLCRRLDGLPLAIELAAARLKTLSCTELAAQLDDRFRLLAGGGGAGREDRHQTLRAALDWSHDLLSADEQAVFRRLSAFAEGWSLEGGIAVGTGGTVGTDAVLDLLAALVDKSLVLADMSAARTRYRMLESTHRYAAEKLAGSGERGVDGRVAAHLVALYGRAEAEWPTMPSVEWLSRYAPDMGNLRGGIERAIAEGDVPLAVALIARGGAIARELSRTGERRRWALSVRDSLGPGLPAEELAELHLALAPDPTGPGAGEVPQEALTAIGMFRAIGDPLGLSRALRVAGVALARPGTVTAPAAGVAAAGVLAATGPAASVSAVIAPAAIAPAHGFIDEAIAVAEPLGASKVLAAALAASGYLHGLAGGLATGRRLMLRAAAMRRTLGDSWGLIRSHAQLAELAYRDGDVAAAIALAEEGVREARRHAAQTSLEQLLANLSGYLLAADRVEEAREIAGEGLRLSRATGEALLATVCAAHLAASGGKGALLPASSLGP